MKALIIMLAITLIAVTARASLEVPVIGMPVGIGYAIDIKGNRQPDVACMRDAIRSPKPLYPIGHTWGDLGDNWKSLIGRDGLFRLDIDSNTGRVTQVTAIKSTGSASADELIIKTLQLWAFKPGKWKAIIVPTTILRVEGHQRGASSSDPHMKNDTQCLNQGSVRGT